MGCRASAACKRGEGAFYQRAQCAHLGHSLVTDTSGFQAQSKHTPELEGEAGGLGEDAPGSCDRSRATVRLCGALSWPLLPPHLPTASHMCPSAPATSAAFPFPLAVHAK